MRLDKSVLRMACIALAAVWPLLSAHGQQKGPLRPKPDTVPAQTDEQSPEDGTKPPEGDAQGVPGAAAGADGKDARLTLKDIEQLRRKHIAPEQVSENVAEQGRGFEVTAEVAGQLRRLGFHPAQIDAIKESSPEPLVPGKWLTTSDAQRDRIFQEMKQVVIKSKAAIRPIESQHVTLWVGKETQQTYLPDLEKLEKFFHTKCAEPIRSGLDKRSTHIVLLKDHAEYQAWWRTMFRLFAERFEEKDNPGGSVHFREEVLKGRSFTGSAFATVTLEGQVAENVRRNVAASVACIYFTQLAQQHRQEGMGPLQAGFVDWVESGTCGSPTVMFGSIIYHQETRYPARSSKAWTILVRQHVANGRATPLPELLKMGTSKMTELQFAEAWTLVGLLNQQPAKFGKLLLAIRKGGSDLGAIEKVYGWDEKKLTKEWRAYVMELGKKGVRSRD